MSMRCSRSATLLRSRESFCAQARHAAYASPQRSSSGWISSAAYSSRYPTWFRLSSSSWCSCWPWMSSSCAETCLSVCSGTTVPLMRQMFLPALVSSREIDAVSSSPSSSISASRAFTFSLSAISNTASTRAFCLPFAISSRSARSPSTRLTASTTIDLPAPVSPVITFMPGAKSMLIASISARLEMLSCSSIAVLLPVFQLI